MRALRVLSLFWRAAVAAELEYRANFIMAALTALGSLVGGLFGLSLFYQRGYTFDGWPWEHALVVLGVFTVLTGMSQALLEPNLSRIVDYVEQGTLDFVLLKPIDAQLHVSVRHVSPWGLPDITLGIGLIIYAGVKLELALSAYALLLLPLVASMAILYGMWFLLATTSIWFVKVYNATEVLRGLLEAGRYPIGAFPAVWRFVFTFVVPVAFLTTVPAEVLLGKATILGTLSAFPVAALLFVLSRAFWRYALRSYTSASS